MVRESFRRPPVRNRNQATSLRTASASPTSVNAGKQSGARPPTPALVELTRTSLSDGPRRRNGCASEICVKAKMWCDQRSSNQVGRQ
ncbi:hypothetical protein Q5P01_021554 [Channa striata]|uniref:Uncharacterized protein n=1 Tax=Channa striata TaxID=64152 RepID=A0AA88S9G2_CHASR|nr:hypothetical protein Q5P01_021554 [Channa striata]